MFESIKAIVYIIYASLMVIITLFNLFFSKKKLKNQTGKTEEAKSELEITNELVNKLSANLYILNDYLVEAMEEAEESGMTGLAKKAYVISLVIQKCAEHGFNYQDIKDQVQSKIEELITFSKKVNPRREQVKEETKENAENNSRTQDLPSRFE